MNIVVADDQAVVRSAVMFVLKHFHPEWSITEAGSFEEVVRELENTCANILLLDWELQPIFSRQAAVRQEAIRRIRRCCPELKIIAMSASPIERDVALEAGIDSFFCKADPPDSLRIAIEAVFHN